MKNNMKTITITINVDGNELSREYSLDNILDFDTIVNSMLETIEQSDKPFKEIPGFEGTMDKLNEF